MLRLLLLRHAKSSWSGTELGDRDRPLSERGRTAAIKMGRFMAAHALVPDLVLCSPARRARDTWNLAAAEFENLPTTLIEDGVYDFGNGENLLNCIRRHGGGARSVLLVGHSPSIGMLAQFLSGQGDMELRSRLARKYPTGGLAIIAVDQPDWNTLSPGRGYLVDFVCPKDLLTDDNG